MKTANFKENLRLFEIRPYWNRDSVNSSRFSPGPQFEIRPYWNRDHGGNESYGTTKLV